MIHKLSKMHAEKNMIVKNIVTVYYYFIFVWQIKSSSSSSVAHLTYTAKIVPAGDVRAKCEDVESLLISVSNCAL